MNDASPLLASRAAALREAFDRTFAQARPADPPASEDLLAIRIGTEPYALRLSEIAGLFADRQVTPVPGRAAALLGIAGFRGALVPVYDLHALLGHPPLEAPRWLAMAVMTPVAFAFGALESHLRIACEAIVSQQPDEGPRRHAREFARSPDLARPIVHLPSVIETLRRQVPVIPFAEER